MMVLSWWRQHQQSVPTRYPQATIKLLVIILQFCSRSHGNLQQASVHTLMQLASSLLSTGWNASHTILQRSHYDQNASHAFLASSFYGQPFANIKNVSRQWSFLSTALQIWLLVVAWIISKLSSLVLLWHKKFGDNGLFFGDKWKSSAY